MKKNMTSFLGGRRLRAGDTRLSPPRNGLTARLGPGGEALMPEDYDEPAGYGARDDFDEPDELDDLDDFDDDDDDEPAGPGRAWPAPGYPPGDPGYPPGGWHRGGGDGTRRGLAPGPTAGRGGGR